MPDVRIVTLGGIEIGSTAGRPVANTTRKTQALLVYLALAPGRPHPRSKLAAMLWQDSDESQARGSLRQALTSLRQAAGFGPEALATTADQVTLAPGAAEVDAIAFEAAAGGASLDDLEAAAACYRGDFLDGFDARAPGFEDWMLAERYRLHARAVDLLRRLRHRHAEAGDSDRAVVVALRLLALEPLEEEAHRALMRLYAGHGRAEAALRQFHICREVLARELAVQPQAETEALYRENPRSPPRPPAAADRGLRRARGRPRAASRGRDPPGDRPRLRVCRRAGVCRPRAAAPPLRPSASGHPRPCRESRRSDRAAPRRWCHRGLRSLPRPYRRRRARPPYRSAASGRHRMAGCRRPPRAARRDRGRAGAPVAVRGQPWRRSQRPGAQARHPARGPRSGRRDPRRRRQLGAGPRGAQRGPPPRPHPRRRRRAQGVLRRAPRRRRRPALAVHRPGRRVRPAGGRAAGSPRPGAGPDRPDPRRGRHRQDPARRRVRPCRRGARFRSPRRPRPRLRRGPRRRRHPGRRRQPAPRGRGWRHRGRGRRAGHRRRALFLRTGKPSSST